MTDDEPSIDLPDGWKATTYKLTGNFKLVAEFEYEETGAKVRVTPQKTYSQPGFANAQRAVYSPPKGGIEEIACGMEIEHVEEAKDAAVEAMNQVSSR